jgi:predicted transcriptional regulator
VSKLINGKQKIISETLNVSHAMVSQTIRGLRGKRGSDLQDRIMKANYKADEIYEKANIEIVQYCRSLKIEMVVPK